MTTFVDTLKYFQSVEDIKMIVLMGEVGNRDELIIADMIKQGDISKPVVARCIGTSAEALHTDVQFGHAGAKANSDEERARYKNTVLAEAGVYVPESFDNFGTLIEQVYTEILGRTLTPSMLLDTIQQKIKTIQMRRKTRFSSTISDERGEELKYNDVLISDLVEKQSLAKVIGHLRLKKELPEYACTFLTTILILLADHGPAVS